jgi:hypothetical protein
MLIPWDYKEIYKCQKSEKCVLSSNPIENVSCSSEAKHDRKTAPRPKLFASAMRLQEQGLQPRNTVLGSSPGEDIFRTMETNDGRIT